MRNVTKVLQILAVLVLTVFVFANSGTAQVTLFAESWENGGSIPAGWANDVTGSNSLTYVTSTTYPSGFTAYDANYLVRFNSYSYNGGVIRHRRTVPVSTVGCTSVGVEFAWLESSAYSGSNDRVDVQYSTDGTTWNTVATFPRYNATQGWTIKNVALPAGAIGQVTLYIAFQFTSAYGNDCYLDRARITAVKPPATVTIGSGTTTAGYPYYTFYQDSRTQLLYTAAQITAAGGTPGIISSLGFNVSSFATQTMNGFNIRFQNTALSSITGWVTTGWKIGRASCRERV